MTIQKRERTEQVWQAAKRETGVKASATATLSLALVPKKLMPLFVPHTLEAGERPFVVLIAGLSFYIHLMKIHARLRNCWITNRGEKYGWKRHFNAAISCSASAID